MLLIQKFRHDNTDENVDRKISKLAAHNSILEKNRFPCKINWERRWRQSMVEQRKNLSNPFETGKKELYFCLMK